ncbi:HNH endonuclease [Aggregicoccus sp. 17bor-14]|uniref:HNH endonuclease n=1 Tax=Myxococcaceae TaxID=31 RepID=UPI00129C8270|nr:MULTISPECIES: HNH endonuclease [Myxococcaceae]MBF5044505.1 HNH endonuclease [Simulacricoccus sp. 17bor-14]MRI90250.1 HNH endonuclease [Aggregicoccus sp. 17bor-14]
MTRQRTNSVIGSRGKQLKNAILGLLKGVGNRGATIHDIRSRLRVGAQQHVDRRLRELDASHTIERRREGRNTFYVYKGVRRKRLNSSAISKSLRAEVLHAHGRQCQMCGRSPAKDKVRLHIDHRIPRAWGGKTVFENLEPLCSACNEGKKNLFKTLTSKQMREILATKSVHERLARALHATPGKPVPARFLMLVANSGTVQDDWQKRLRELRYIGLKITVSRHKTPEGHVTTDYTLTNWVRLPSDTSERIRRIERSRAARRTPQ